VGYDHDASLGPAGVVPSRAQLPGFDAWFATLLTRLDAELPAQLAEHWRASFCQASSFTAEAAARCAYGATPPPAACNALAELSTRDVDRVIARFAVAPTPL